jgi:thiol:disulfide interchange protein DsbD
MMTLLLALLALLSPQDLPGTPKPRREKPVVKILEIRLEKKDVKADEVVKVAFDLEIPAKWHIYPAGKKPLFGTPTVFMFEGADITGPILEPAPKLVKEEGIGDIDYHEGKITITVPIRLKGGAKPGPVEVTGKINYQICDPNLCVDNSTPISFHLNVVEGKAAPAPSGGGAAGEAAKEFEQKGLGWLLGLSVIGGLISLIMPCVYPLIPITITYFVKQAGVSRGTGLLLSGAYAVGIVATFTGLGFLLTLSLGAQGAQKFASNPWVNLTMAGMFMVFALSLLGLFEIQLPSALTGRLSGSGPKSGVFGAFVLGLLFSVVSFTCTIPIAATILGVAASAEHRLAGFLAMLVYSGTMAVPFLLLGFFPSMVKELPKSGGWLHVVKVSAGFFEVALAAAYIWKADFVWSWGLFDRGLVLSVWVAVCFVTSLYLLGLFRMKGDGESREIGFARVASALLFGILAFFLIGGLLGRPVGIFNVVLPPEEKSAVVGKGGATTPGPKVYEDLAEAEAVAKKENKPVFVEFTGYT